MKRFILILLLGFLVNLVQAQVSTKYKTSKGDGYDGSYSESFIWEIFQPGVVCVGEDALFTMQIEGSLLYSYRWYKIGDKNTTLSTESFYLIKNCQAGWDGWQYMCEVTDLNTGETFQPDDTFRLNVKVKPVAKWVNTKRDTTICYGQKLNLKVVSAKDDDFEEYVYTWFGAGSMGETYKNQITVLPEEDTKYFVTLSNRYCVSDTISVSVHVKHSEVRLPQDIVYTVDGQVQLMPSEGEGGTLDWFVNGMKYANQTKFSWNMPDDMAETTVKVTRTVNGCTASDSTVVLNELAMKRFIGGDNDGFVESQQKLSVSGITPVLSEVCMGEDAYFTCNVGTIGTFTYQWYRYVDGKNDIELSGATDNLLVLATDDFDVAGKYYCVVYDLDTKKSVTTDPATLVIIERPEVAIVTPDTAICVGGQMVLKANREADEGEIFRWNGLNIQTNPTYQQITVAPEETAVYQLVAMKGTCLTTQEVKVEVRDVQLHLPDIVDVLLGDTVKLTQPEEPLVQYVWTANGGKTPGKTWKYLPQQNMVVHLEKRIGECSVTDSTLIYVKEYGVGLTQEALQDGYAESILPFYIMSLDCPQKLCRGDEAVLNVEVAGYDVYQYCWKKRKADGSEVVIDSVKQHIIANVADADAGVYFCEVKDIRSGKVIVSDDLTMEVLPRPVAGIYFVEPGKGDVASCWVCAGTSLILQADQGDGWTYLWEGMGLLGATDKPTVNALPEESTDYSLVVSNGVCSDMTFVQVNVQDIAVDIPEVKIVGEGEPFVIAPINEISGSAILEWVFNKEESVKANQFASSGITESGYLKVTMKEGECTTYDSTRIYVRGFNTFQGGEEDGFVESNSSFMIEELHYPTVICENGEADFSIRVKGSGVYSYSWKQVGLSTTLSSESVLSLGKCTMDMSGEQYYCLVTDLMLGKTLSSDTISLNIRKGPKAVIGYPERGKAYCIGTKIRLDARKTEDFKESPDIEYVYSWEGQNVSPTESAFAVEVIPTESQIYTLKVSAEACSAYDTIQINVIDPRVAIPSVIYAEENQDLEIPATVSNVSINATINWWHNALFTPDVNPFIIESILESANVVAEVVDRGCKFSDTARVYVRTSRFFAGGDDDGFMESCNIPEINPDIPTVLGCGGVDSVEMNVLYTGEPKTFVWQRYDKDAGKFADVSESDQLFGLGTPSLKIKPLTADFYGQYRCVLTNDCGSTYSLTYKVSNGNAPVVAVHEDTVAVCEGVKDHQIVMVLQEDETVGEVTYRWYRKNPVTGVTMQFTPEVAFNKNVYMIPEVTPEYDAVYIKEAEGVCGTARDSVRLIVNKKVGFKIQPLDTLVCYNSDVPLRVYSQDGGICTYTLKKVIPDKNLFEGYRVDKIFRTSSVNRYDFKPVLMEDDGYYVWTVKSICGDSVTSRMFKLTVEKPVQFIAQTPDTAACMGTTLTLNVVAESPDCPDSQITYEWTKLSEGKLTYKTPSISMNVTNAVGGTYLCSATNVCGTATLLKPIEVAIHPELVITQNPVWNNAGLCEETTLELNFAVNRRDVVDSIRWFRKENGLDVPVLNEGTRITGADDYALRIDSIRGEEEGVYYARVFNVCGVYETMNVKINVHEKPKIINPIEYYFDRKIVCLGEKADLKILAGGEPTLIYTWEKNDNLVSGAVDSVLQVTFDEDAVYRCIVHNHCSQAISEWSVNVVRPDTFRFKAVDKTHYCEGQEGVRLLLSGSDPECTYSLYCQKTAEDTPELVEEIKGEDAYFTGGSLDFGVKPAGLYYVMAYDPELDCEGRMPGDVEVIMDSLPKVFNLEIGYPICEGNVVGTIVLDSSQYSVFPRYQYILQRQETSGWQTYAEILYGTGDTLIWKDVLAGVYRVEATDLQSGCVTLMNGIADLSEHPNPVLCDLIQYQGDTAYCEGEQIDVALRMNMICFTEGQTYTLMKNQTLTDEVRTDNSGWTQLAEGEYAVVVKNEWGCADTTNTIRIHNYPLPAKKNVGQNRFYCDGGVTSGETALISVSDVDPGIKYAFYRKGEVAPFEEIYKGTSAYASTEVSLVDANYYVIATDTATGCSVPMIDTVFVRGSKMELSYTPVIMDRSENPIRLNLTVKNAIGNISVKWEPEDQIQDMTDPLQPWVDMTDLNKNSFTVTVTDTVCSKTERIVVSLKGQALTASIKDPATGSDIPHDTLWLCEGATYSLDGEVLGGKEPFAYGWSINGSFLSNKKKLTNAVAVESGNLVFQVSSNGRVVKDSIRLELYPAPGKGLKVNTPDVCVALGDVFAMNLVNAKPGVTYSLEYSKNNDVFRSTGITTSGDQGRQVSLERVFAEDKAGYYRVQAQFTYDGTTCTSVHDTVKVGVGVYKANFHGGGDYCVRNGLDSLVLDSTVVGATYWVVYKDTEDAPYLKYDKAGIAAGDGDSLFFVGDWPSGFYRIAAQKKDATCVDTMPGEVRINHLNRPNPGTLASDQMEYCITPGNTVKVNISLKGAEAGNTYRLYRQNGSSVELLKTTLASQDGDFTFGTDYSERGRYFSVANNGVCLDTAGYVLIGQLPEGDIEIAKIDTGYCAGNVRDDIRLNVYPVGSDVHYYIYPVGYRSPIAECNLFVDDTVRFNGHLDQGNYVLKAKVAECEKEIGMFSIAEYALPYIVDLIEPKSGCEGTMLDMGVKGSQTGVLYEVSYEKDAKHMEVIASKYGDGNDLTLMTADSAGTYYVQARDTLTGCVQTMENYAILAKPKNFDFIATDTVYCAFGEESGTRFALSGTEAGVVYVLQQYDAVADKFIDVEPRAELTGIGANAKAYFSGNAYKAGKYRVRTTTCEGSVVGEELEIRALEMPADSLLVDLTGNGCVDSTMNIHIKATENGVKYSLWKGDSQVLTDLTGDGADHSWTVNPAVKGTYKIHALREGATRTACAVTLKREINVETLPLVQPLRGISPICQYTTTTLEIPISDENVKYTLHRVADDVKVIDGKAGKIKVVFDSVSPGTYYAMAAHGDCRISTPVFALDSILVPDIDNVLVDYTRCIEQGGGQIIVDDLQDSLNYVLVYPDGKEEKFIKMINTSKTFDNLKIGTYYLKVQDKKTTCFSLNDTLYLNSAVPAGDTLVGPFGYCKGKSGVKLKLNHTTMNVKYMILSDARDTLETIFGGMSVKAFQNYYAADTLLKKSEYIFVVERQGPFGGCRTEQSIWVELYTAPDLSEKLELQETGALCAGSSYHISVVDAQEKMTYILYKGNVPVDTVVGNNNPNFKAVSGAGDYTVIPKNGGICGTKPLDTLFHINTLPAEIFVEQPLSYCNPADLTVDKGAALKVYNTVSKVRYVLNDGTNDVDTLYGDYSLAYQEFDKMPAGSYTIIATDTLTGCSNVVGKGDIIKNVEPKRFVCGVDGQRCAMAAPVEIADSETGVDYYLHKNGKKIGEPVAGADGTVVSFGEQTEPGIYQILAVNKLGCSVYMKDSVIVYPPLIMDTLIVKGSYCERQSSDINFRLRKQSLYWKYFIVKAEDLTSSDTLAGAENSILSWEEVGGKDIRSGKYCLYAMNPCGDVQKLDSVVVDTNHLPERYFIEEGDFTVCAGDSGTITLSASQTEVEYDLIYRSELGVEKCLLTKTGTGNKLLLGKVDAAGRYIVIGRMKATGCTDTVASIQVNLMEGIQSPGIKAEDVCLTDDPGKSLDVTLQVKHNNISYYLQRIHGADTVMVDSIRWGIVADAAKKTFAAQTAEGIYQVVAQGPTCKKAFPAAMVGRAAADQQLNPAGVAAICGGNAKEIGLLNSEVGVQYEVYRVERKEYESEANYITTNIVAAGTGAALKLGELSSPGVYTVKANNGCSVLMSDTLRLNVNEAYEIKLRENYIICGANDSVQIEILGRTNPVENAQYIIYEPGKTTYSEIIVSGNKEASVKTEKWYKKPGFYRVEGIDVTGCPELDSVEIKVLPLPDVYPVILRGNKYLCDNASRKEIVVEGAQTGVDYHLYRVVNGGAPEAVTMKSAQSADVEIVFTVYQEGTYYIMGQYNDKGQKSCPVKMDGEIELTPVEMHKYALESIQDIYCDDPAVTRKGEVKLISSDAGVEYQLYQDGVPYGDAKQTTTAGAVLTWENLPGGMPKMSAGSEAKPVKYTVRATDVLTRCEVDMNGTVGVIAERSIVFSDKQLQDAIPTCLGGRLNMVVLAYGGKISYQWKKGGVALADGKQYYYTKDAITAGDIGSYHCEMTNTCGTVKTPDIEVVPALLIDRPTKGIDTSVVCNLRPDEVRAVNLTSKVANADGWEWYKDGELLEDEIYNLLEIGVSTKQGAGVYTCKASNNCGFVWDTCVVLVDSTPRIDLITPVHRDTLCAGTAWELKVNANQPVSWMRGTQTTAYTGNVMRIDPVKTSDKGTYFVVADNQCGVVKEEVAMLVVDTLIEVISKQEQFYVCRQSGELPRLFIQTDPRDRVYYRWEDREGTVLGTGNELTNIDLNKYTHLVDTFRVYYGNRCEDSYKDIALVTSDFIQFKQPVEEIGVCVKDMLPDTVLRVEVMNGQEVTYKWFKTSRADTIIARDSVGNTASLAVSLDNTKNAGYYYCYIANQCVDTVSRIVNVRIDTLPAILVNLPEKDTLCSGSEMKLRVSARAGEGSVKYSWYIQKKGEAPVNVATALYFGLSQSEYKCFVDETYDGALVWCDMATYCSNPQADTLRLTVLPAPQLNMSTLAALNCDGQENEIYVKLDKGEKPWKYKYSVNEKENTTVHFVTGDTDTLKVTEPGIYRVYWMEDSRCILTGKELAVTEFSMLKRSKFTFEALNYTEPVCPDSEITLRVKISGDVPGPWNVGIYRDSDGELATELGIDKVEYTLDSIHTYSFNIQKDEKYFAKVTNVYIGQECEAEALVKSVELKVIPKPKLESMNDLKPEDRIVSVCNNVSLGKLFNVQPSEGGWYIVGNQQLSGDWILNPEQKKYSVGYRIYQNGCVFNGYDLGEIEFRPRPSLKKEILNNHVICGPTEYAVATFRAEGEAPIEVTYRILNIHKDGKQSLGSTVTLQLPMTEPDPRFNYDEDLAGKIIEVLRVQDKFKCLQADTLLVKDTILFPERPEFNVYSKRSDSILWKLSTDAEYRIRRGETVDLRVELKKGETPWTLSVIDRAMEAHGFEIPNIQTVQYDTALHEVGFYEIDVIDKYCGTDVFADKSFVTVNVVDTAFLSLKACLQGPWNSAKGKMESAVLDQIDKHGLSKWPDVGGRKIIDWVIVELWKDDVAEPEFWDDQWCLLLDDGTIVDKEGDTNLKLMGKTSSAQFRVAIRSRNHLATWSKVVDLSATTPAAPCEIDFTKASHLYMEPGESISKYAYMDGAGRMLLYGGEVNSNRLVTSFDPNRVTREVLSLNTLEGIGALLLDVNYNGRIEWPGYNVDVNGSVEFMDWAIMYKNRSKYSIVPEREINW